MTVTNTPSSAADGGFIDEFSQRLSRSYEEINLLFRISRLLNSQNDSPSVIRAACDQMAEILPFGWLAIWFSIGPEVVPSLAGFLARSGQLPCPDQQFHSIAADLHYQSASEPGTKVLVPGRHPLAAICGTEVLAEPIAHHGKCVGLILGGSKSGNDPDVTSDEMQFLEAAANFLGVFHENSFRFAEQRAQYLGMLRALSAAIDAKDAYTRGHSDRVALLTARLAHAIGLDPPQVEQFRIAGQLHDVGKIGVPEAVLCKVGRLTDEEFAQIKKHPEIGFGILKDIPGMEPILPGVLHHHERWDGRGYPHKLAGEQIPLPARCIALADTFDAMSSARSYRSAMTRNQVLDEIRRFSGSQFNPELTATFVSLDFSDFDTMLASVAA